MPATKSNNKRSAPRSREPRVDDAVLTLAEAAAYLRVSEDEVLRQVREQGLPGRQVGEDWRFLKSALRWWLSAPRRGDFWETQLGAFKDDPGLENMVEAIYQKRGRPSAEEQ